VGRQNTKYPLTFDLVTGLDRRDRRDREAIKACPYRIILAKVFYIDNSVVQLHLT
jgi:hypothetical protein